MSANAAGAEGEGMELVELGAMGEKVRQLEVRAATQEGQIRDLSAGQAGIREELAGMRGEIRGALAASKVSGAVVGSLVSLAGSGAVALLLFLLGKR